MAEKREPGFAPTPHQEKTWKSFVDLTGAPTEDGWWMGWCPLHDKGPHEPGDTPSAHFHFWKGIMRCLADDPCTAPRRTMSLHNVAVRAYDLATRGNA